MLAALKGYKHIIAARAYVIGGIVLSGYDVLDQVAKADSVDLFSFVPPNWHGAAMVATGFLVESARRNLTPTGDAK